MNLSNRSRYKYNTLKETTVSAIGMSENINHTRHGKKMCLREWRLTLLLIIESHLIVYWLPVLLFSFSVTLWFLETNGNVSKKPPLPSPSFSAPYAYAFGVIILFLTSLQSVLDAQWLAYQVQMYYASEGDRREEILKTFNVFPEKFDHMTVVKELNSEIESGVLTGSVEDKE